MGKGISYFVIARISIGIAIFIQKHLCHRSADYNGCLTRLWWCLHLHPPASTNCQSRINDKPNPYSSLYRSHLAVVVIVSLLTLKWRRQHGVNTWRCLTDRCINDIQRDSSWYFGRGVASGFKRGVTCCWGNQLRLIDCLLYVFV